MREIMAILPEAIRSILTALPSAVKEHLEEIRLRQNQPLEVRFGQQSSYVTPTGQLTSTASKGWIFPQSTQSSC
ncbi:stage III sporulation protein AA [Brevibacillus agri BAB-2500]|nr:stage III sporulation protein AA [Brevibacillus agri BAB-2500]